MHSLSHASAFLATCAAPMAIAACASDLPTTARTRRLLTGGATLATAFGLFRLGESVYRNVRMPSPWDFAGFWIVARAALAHANFYDPAVLARLARPLDVPALFQREIVDTGFWYPPATALLVAPLGLLGERSALVAWYLVLGLALAAAAAFLRRTFFKNDGFAGYVAAGGLVVTLPGTIDGVAYAQTAGLAFALLLASLHARDRPQSGIWLGLAALVKPFVAIVVVADLIGKRRARAAHATGAIVAASLVAVVAFGPGTTLAFVVDRPTSRVPAWVYREPSNQSLWAMLLRHDVSAAHIVGALVAAAVIVATAILVARAARAHGPLVAGIAVAAVLLVYPVAQTFYGTFLALPILAVWQVRGRLPGGTAGALALVVANVVASAFADGTFLAASIDWLATCLALALATAPARAPTRSAALA